MSELKQEWDGLVSGKELDSVARKRLSKYEKKTERASISDELVAEGWELDRELANKKIRVKKLKQHDELFENRVWELLYKMGFSTMNKDRQFRMRYGQTDGNEQQIDVFAMDDETALVVECKSAVEPGTGSNFKKQIEAIISYRDPIRNFIRNKVGRKQKVKFIFATENYVLNLQDRNRLREGGIAHFDENTIEYYEGLSSHLGSAAKYQLLGSLFAGVKIENMPTTVPAIRGNMGGHLYYSFAIEPSRLLKIGYVLHRNDANTDQMPTYQRVIKKARLRQIRQFIEKGGYFPNSIIISLETKRNRKLVFDRESNCQNETDSKTQIGVLHLPPYYRSAYIIDGQHRLYGYADTKYENSATVPVVAFENLDKSEQVNLFMEINEHQKSVPKQLRNTLNADLLWDSSDLNERRKAIGLTIAKKLSEDSSSPLFGRVITGENEQSDTRCISMEIISKALMLGDYFTSFKDGKPIHGHVGLFDEGPEIKSEAIDQKLYPYILRVLSYFKSELPSEWSKGKASEGILSMNTGIYAIVRIASDILNYSLTQNTNNRPLYMETDAIFQLTEPYLSYIVDFYNNMSENLRREIKNQYGGKGPVKHWRYLQKAIHDQVEDFPVDKSYDIWWLDNSKIYNQDSKSKLEQIVAYTKQEMKDSFIALYGKVDSTKIPLNIRQKYAPKEMEYNEKRDSVSKAIDTWHFLTLDDYADIILASGKWRDYYSQHFSLPPSSSVDGQHENKEQKVAWMRDMQKIINGLMNKGYSVTKANYDYICKVYNFCNGAK